MQVFMLGLTAASMAIAAPTFTKDVAPIFYRNCVSCHRSNEIAPMSLVDYKTARPWAKAIREAVVLRKMPLPLRPGQTVPAGFAAETSPAGD